VYKVSGSSFVGDFALDIPLPLGLKVAGTLSAEEMGGRSTVLETDAIA
jgi:hypothetical protein